MKITSLVKIFIEFLTFNIFLVNILINQKYLIDKGIKNFLSSVNLFLENSFLNLILGLIIITIFQEFIFILLNLLGIGDKYIRFKIYLNKIFSYSFGLFSGLYLIKVFNLSRFGIILCFLCFFIYQVFDFYLDKRISKKISFTLIIFLFLSSYIYTVNVFQQSGVEVSADNNNINIPQKTFEYENFEIINREKYYIAYDELVFSETVNYENNLNINYFSFCCHQFAWINQGLKSVGYIDEYKNNIIYINSYGDMFYFEIPEVIEKNNINLIPIKNNLVTLIKNKNIFEFNMEGIKGLEIINGKIFISLTEEVFEGCVNTPVYSAELNFENIIFSEFFTYEECAIRDQELFNAHQSGGKILDLKDGSFLLSIGDYRQYEAAQNPDSFFGKIVRINIETKTYEIVSLGHRNPQGLEIIETGEFILETEHGPQGGDEINIIELNKQQNFGWPISSYGEHYNLDYYNLYGNVAPLHKSHEDYGYIEPIIYFPYEQVGSHGISDIEKNYFSKNSNSYFIGTLNQQVIYEINLDLINKKVDNIISYQIDERVRDIEYIENGNFYILLLENTPSFGFLSKTN